MKPRKTNRFTEAQIREMRNKHRLKGVTLAYFARKFGVSHSAVSYAFKTGRSNYLTAAQVADIKRCYRPTISMEKLGVMYGISGDMIRRILIGEAYEWVV